MMLSRATRVSLARVRGQVPSASYSSLWDRVRPSEWHPIATLEQSMMDMDRAASRMISAPWQVAQSMVPRMHKDDGEFFKDLIPSSKKKHKDDKMSHGEDTKLKAEQEAEADGADQGFSSYSYSSSSVVDEGGHRVTSVRRRYEDSAGRLKAVHEREIDGTKVKSVWFRTKNDDEGEQKTLCDDSTSVQDFDEQWKQTPFGKAEATAGNHELSDGVKAAEKESEQCIPGPDYEAAEKAPAKKCGKEAEGTTKESHDKSRKEAIAEGSKTQEEETTPQSGAGYGYS